MCADLTIGVAATGARKKPDDGFASYEMQFPNISLMPRGFPIAPEDDEFSEEIRQMNVGRYRVLFTIRKRNVHVLHVRGAHF